MTMTDNVTNEVNPAVAEEACTTYLVGWPRMEAQHARLAVLAGGILLDNERGRFRLVDEVRVEDVELVALHHLRGRVVVVVVRLVVLVPLVPGMHTVEVLRLARPVLVVPPVHLSQLAFHENVLRPTSPIGD